MTPAQRRAQVGRIHAAGTALGLNELEYRDLLDALCGCRSCSAMTDRQVNHALDWLNYLAGRRSRQPVSFAPDGGQANLVRLCYAIRQVVPPGFERAPMLSSAWRERTAGRSAPLEELTAGELVKLVEGIKAIFRRAGRAIPCAAGGFARRERRSATP